MIFTKTSFSYIAILSQDIQKIIGVLNALFPNDPFAAMMTEEADNVEANCSTNSVDICGEKYSDCG